MGIFNDPNSSEEIGFLDMITIAGFLAQIDNMSKDDVQNKYIHKVIKAIAVEIEKFHQERYVDNQANGYLHSYLPEEAGMGRQGK